MRRMCALLVHMGMNIGDKYYPEFVFEEDVWNNIVDKCVGCGFTHIVLDVGGGIRSQAYPKLAVKGSWEPEKVNGEVKRLKELGITLIPKLNFSAAHDMWFQEYGREKMSTPEYYRVCEELIAEVLKIFEYPAYMHLGFDEEFDNIANEENHFRTKEQKLKDYGFLCSCVRSYGATPFIWQDMFADYNDATDYLGNDVIIGSAMNDTYEKKDWIREHIENGFQVVLITSNSFTKNNARATVGCYFNSSLRHGILGYIACPRLSTTRKNEAAILEEIELLGSAVREYYLEKAHLIPNVTRADVKRAVEELGIQKGDTVLVHSSYTSLGKVENGAQDVIDGFVDVIGQEGTLVFPTFTQKNFAQAYDTWHLDKHSDTGYLTNYFRKLDNVVRSDQATHSVAAMGKDAKRLTKTHGHTAKRYGDMGDTPFSQDSPWEKMYWSDAKIVLLGVNFRKITFRHYAEYCYIEDCLRSIEKHPEYQKMKNELAAFGKPGVWPHVANLWVYDHMKHLGCITKSVCGDARLFCVGARDFVDFVSDALENRAQGIIGMHCDEMNDWLDRLEKLREESRRML